MQIAATNRLYISELTTGHAGFILELTNTAEWIQFIGDKGIKDIAAAENYINSGPRASYAQWGHGLYLISLKDTGAAVGICGIIQRDTLPHKDIGFALLPAYTGHGYAYEAAVAVLEHASQSLGINKVLAITLPSNKRSIGLLTKLQLVFDKMITLPGGKEKLMLFTTP